MWWSNFLHILSLLLHLPKICNPLSGDPNSSGTIQSAQGTQLLAITKGRVPYETNVVFAFEVNLCLLRYFTKKNTQKKRRHHFWVIPHDNDFSWGAIKYILKELDERIRVDTNDHLGVFIWKCRLGAAMMFFVTSSQHLFLLLLQQHK